MRDVTIEIRPREQFRAYLERRERWACLVVHRRGGKTYSCIQDLILKAGTYKRGGPPTRYAYIAPTLAQAKDIAWGYIKEFTHAIPGVQTNESELKVTLPNGAIIRLYSGDNYERMRGLYFDGVVLDEPEDIPPSAWPEVIRPCLVDYSGWATWIGTLKGKTGQWQRYLAGRDDPNWFTLLLKASESGILPVHELEDIRKNTPKEAWEQEFECNPNIGRPGALFARLVTEAYEKGRVMDIKEPDGSEPVWTFWDLGSPLNTRCTYVQFVGREIHVIDHDYNHEFTPAERVQHMRDKGYRYAGHFFPHDAAAKEKSGLNFQQQMEQAGLQNIRIIPRCHEIWPGVNKLGELFPRIIFNRLTCAYLLESLENYRTKPDQQGFQTDRVVEDWSCHSCFPAGTLIKTSRGSIPIEEVIEGDWVETPAGLDKVVASGITGYSDTLRIIEVANKRVSSTMDHPFLTDRGLVPAGNLTNEDRPWTSETDLESLLSMAPVTTLRDDITTRLKSIRGSATSTETFGSSTMGQFLQVMRSTTRTMIRSITRFPIWSLLSARSIGSSTQRKAVGADLPQRSNLCWKRLFLPQELGIPALPEGNGTVKMPSDLLPNVFHRRENAPPAASRISRETQRNQPDSAELPVNKEQETDSTESNQSPATNAAKSFRLTDNPSTAHPCVRGERVTRLSVQKGERQPVYNLTTEKHHCYYANGFLVSNCDSMRMLAEAMLNGMLRGHHEVIRSESPSLNVRVITGPGELMAPTRGRPRIQTPW